MEPSARIENAALWWGEGTPRLPDDPRPCGLIGDFRPRDAADAARILAEAETLLRAQGCAVALGPMDGSTWRSYRLVTGGTENRPPFLMEPTNPPEWPTHFVSAGWSPLARYVSSVAPLDSAVPNTRARAQMEANGIRIRSLRMADYENEMRRIFPTCLRSFASNFLFTPISESAFVARYFRAAPIVDPDLVLIAERDSLVTGFVFCLRDGPALIVKTLARLPDRAFAGLGAILLEQVHAIAKEKGMTEAIHALKHEDNPSCQTSARHGSRVFREYTLYHKPLTSP